MPHLSPAVANAPFAPGTARRATLDAAVRRLVPDGADAAAVACLVADKLALLPDEKRLDFARGLDALGARVAAIVAVGRAVPFHELAPDEQDRMLAAWERSPVPLLRTVFQAVRRLALALYYSTPEAHARIGYRGPLHERAVELPWEGPMPGVASDEEPVARRPHARGAPPEHHVATDRADDHHHSVAGWRVPSPQASAWSRPGAVLRPDDLADGARLTADVVVIGTGAGGSVAACRLAESGRDVLLVEEGSLLRQDDFTEREAELTERLYADNGLRATDDLSVLLFQGRAVGGGTTVNWLIMLRPHERVLDEWVRRHGLVGHGAAELAPVFDRIEREVHARLVPDDAHSPNNRIVLDGARALGWAARAGAINARGCVRAGFCGQGCRYDAKQGTLQVYLPRALAAGARLLPEARAERIEVVGRGLAGHSSGRASALPMKRVTVALREPVTGRVRGRVVAEAPVVVVAGGAVGTPVLLQRSGLGGGGVGRWLRLHPTAPVSAFYDRPIYAAAGIPLSALCDEFRDMNGDGYGAWIECPPTHPSLAAVALPGFGRVHAGQMARFVHMGTLIVLVRDGADLGACNGTVGVDRAGRTHVDYRLGTTDAAHMTRGMQAAARLHLAAGAREVRTVHADQVVARAEADVAAIATRSLAPNRFSLFSAHVNGTCRMGTDPRTSGTTPDAERHGVPGLYVADGSLFPTAIGVNPQETILALGSMVGERIAERW